MAIEFNCPHCDKSLSTSEDRAGRKAKCPGCGEVVTVPGEIPPPLPVSAADDLPPPPRTTGGRDDRPRIDCPMCGGQVLATAKKCKHCGEELAGIDSKRVRSQPTGEHSLIDAGDVISTGWAITMKNLGICIGAEAIVFGLGLLAYLMLAIPMAIAGKPDKPEDLPPVMIVYLIVYMVSLSFGAVYLQAGYVRLILNLARGETASIKDLFSGSSHLLNLYLVNLIQNVGLTFASCFCLIPGLFLLPIFWAVPYVLIAERPPGIDAISRAIDYTRGNRLQILLIILVSMLIHFAGVCFCLGGLITFPLISMLTAVSYLRMTGQPTAEG